MDTAEHPLADPKRIARFEKIRVLTAEQKMALPAAELAWYREEKALRSAAYRAGEVKKSDLRP